MTSMGVTTDAALLDVELPCTLIDSPSVSTFLAEEEASICPLLSNSNGVSTPLTFSHPLTPCANDNTSANLSTVDAKAETNSSSGSSSVIGMDGSDNAATTLFNKHPYQHLQLATSSVQDSNGHGANGNHSLSKNTPLFVSWNWPLIRKFTFFVFMSSLLAMCALVVAMIVSLPKTCNPKTAWYRGSVFYEIYPASFQDSNNDGIGDIRGIGNRVDYLSAMGISAVRLNSIFASPYYPNDYDNVSSLMDVASILGGSTDLHQLSESLHERNISLILDLPIYAYVYDLEKAMTTRDVSIRVGTQFNTTNSGIQSTTTRLIVSDNVVTAAIRKWIELGVDGFYLKGLEHFVEDEAIIINLAEWKRIIGTNRVIIISEPVFNRLKEETKATLLSYIDLVDVYLDVIDGTIKLEDRLKTVLSGKLTPTESAWIHWSIGGAEKQRISSRFANANYTLAATIMQLMLPGTPSIFYGDEIALESASDLHNEHGETKHLHHLATMQWSNTTFQFTNRETLPWLPQTASYTFENFKLISKMIQLRDRSPSIYKNSICKTDTKLSNTEIHRSVDILIIERVYPRRNSFVSFSNFGHGSNKTDLTSMYYIGQVMLETTTSEKIYFADFEIGPLQTIVVKLDK